MMAAATDVLTAVYQRALHEDAEAQTWPGHFLFKRVETQLILQQATIAPNAVGLELGCGNGFQSMLLASQCRWLVSTDLPSPNPHTHTVGMDKAQTLLSSCGVRNIHLVGAAAETLPFPDAQFDFVFSSSVLEHVAGRREAGREMARMLKPGGQMIIAVPTHIASLCAFPHVVLYLVIRAAQIMWRRLRRSPSPSTPTVPTVRETLERDQTRGIAADWAAFWRHHPSFPLPEPHGTYGSVIEEFRAQFPTQWRRLIEGGGFRVERCFGLTLVPISLLEVFSPSLMARFYAWTRIFHDRVATHPLAQSTAYIWAAVCRKPTSTGAPAEARLLSAATGHG